VNLDFAGMHADRKPQVERLGGLAKCDRTSHRAHRAVEPGADLGADAERMTAMTRNSVSRAFAEPVDSLVPEPISESSVLRPTSTAS
jgi:hypothetical protein